MNDLKILEENYGKDMIEFCNKYLHAAVVNEPEKLVEIITKHFEPSTSLVSDIISSNKIEEFTKYVNSFDRNVNDFETYHSPNELFSQVGYIFRVANTPLVFEEVYKEIEDKSIINIDEVTKPLKNYFVYFAIKTNYTSYKQKKETGYTKDNFINDNTFGSSILRIEINKNDANDIRIYDRYNVCISDNYDIDLEDINPGLTSSILNKNGLSKPNKHILPDIYPYVSVNNKLYRYNTLLDNIYCCNNNIIIDKGGIKRLPKNDYILFDNYVLNIKNKSISNIYENVTDGFYNLVKDTTKVQMITNEENQGFYLGNKDNSNITKITLDENNAIKECFNPFIDKINDNFLSLSTGLEDIRLTRAESIGDNFALNAFKLKNINLRNLKKAGNNMLSNSYNLENIKLDFLESIGDNAFTSSSNLKSIDMPRIKKIGENFATEANLEFINLPEDVNINRDGLNEEIKEYLNIKSR